MKFIFWSFIMITLHQLLFFKRIITTYGSDEGIWYTTTCSDNFGCNTPELFCVINIIIYKIIILKGCKLNLNRLFFLVVSSSLKFLVKIIQHLFQNVCCFFACFIVCVVLFCVVLKSLHYL